jgi:large subunit ribosomal protein L9
MKVILLQNVERLGKAGDVVDVAPGYGRNYLVPQGLAEILTKKGMKQVEIHQQLVSKKAERDLEYSKELAQRIEGQSFEVKAKVGARGKLYGSITSHAIAESMTTAIGEKIDKRNITLTEPVRILGSYDAVLKLHPEVQVNFKINVTAAEGSKISIPEEEEG